MPDLFAVSDAIVARAATEGDVSAGAESEVLALHRDTSVKRRLVHTRLGVLFVASAQRVIQIEVEFCWKRRSTRVMLGLANCCLLGYVPSLSLISILFCSAPARFRDPSGTQIFATGHQIVTLC